MNIVNKLSTYARGKIDDKSEICLRKKYRYIQCDGKSRLIQLGTNLHTNVNNDERQTFKFIFSHIATD